MQSESGKTTKWSKLASLSSVCVLLLLFMPFPSSGQSGGAEQIQNYTLEYPCEIAVLIDGSSIVKDPEFKKMIEVVHQFPKHFKMGSNYSRVAVITFGNEAKINLDLTADENLVQTLDISRQSKPMYTMTYLALQEVKQKVFMNARPDALKIVVLITDGYPRGPDEKPYYRETEAAADELKKDGSLIYVAFIGKMAQEVNDHVNRVAGDPSQVFPMQDFDALKRNIMPQVTKQVKCQFRQACRFDDLQQQRCVEAWWRLADNGTNCTNSPPAQFPSKCQTTDCTATCEKWEWQPWTCNGSNAGKPLMVNREAKIPLKHGWIMENCPKQKEIVCPTKDPGAVNPPEDSSNTRGGLQPWAIAVIAVVVGLLLLLILMAAVLTVRKHKKEREAAAALAKKKADAEMAAMASKKAAGSMSRSLTPSMRSYGLEYGNVPAKMIDHSVGVSLAPLTTKPGASKMPSSRSAVKMQTSASRAPDLVGTKRKPSLSPAQGPVGAKGLQQSMPTAPVGKQGPKPSPGGTQGAKWTPPKSTAVKSSAVSKSISTAKGAGIKKGK